MTTSKRLAGWKIEKFEKNITKRGQTKKGNGFPVGPFVLGLVLFVVVGSYIFQIIRTATIAE